MLRSARLIILGVTLILVVLVLVADVSFVTLIGIATTTYLGCAACFSWLMERKMRGVIDVGDPITNLPVDVSDQARPAPALLNRIIVVLTRFGFRRLGEYTMVTIAGKEIATIWLYVSADHRVTAALFPNRTLWGGMMIRYASVFLDDDDLWVYTTFPSGFPLGETFNGPDLYSHHIQTTPQAAYQHHRDLIARLAETHGPPRPITTMDDYLTEPSESRTRRQIVTQRRLKLMQKLQVLLPGSMAALALLATLAASKIPGVAAAVMMTAFTSYFLYLALAMQIHPRAKQRLVGVTAVLLVLFVPAIIVEPQVILAYTIFLIVLIFAGVRFIPAETRAFVKEIESGKTGIDVQRTGDA